MTVVLSIFIGGLAYLSSFRTLLIAADFLDRIIPSKIRGFLIERLYGWWDRIATYSYPELAKKEASSVLATFDSFVASHGSRPLLLFAFSLVSTHVGFVASHLVNIYGRLSSLGDYFASLEYVVEISISICWLLHGFIIIKSLLKFVRKKSTSAIELAFIYSRDVFLAYLVFNIHEILSTTMVSSSSIVSLVLVTFFIIVLEMVKRKERVYTLLGIWVSLIALLLLIEFTPNPLTIAGMSTMVKLVNVFFDFLTITVTIAVLRIISASKSNLLAFTAILGDFVFAVTLGVAAFFSISLVNSLFLDEPNTWVEWFLRTSDLFKIQVSRLLTPSFMDPHYPQYPVVYLALSTVVPSIMFFSTLTISFFAITGYQFTGKSSKYLFYRKKGKEKRTPVYLTFVFTSTILSMIPAVLGYYSALPVITELLEQTNLPW